jgi:hypothetical protein
MIDELLREFGILALRVAVCLALLGVLGVVLVVGVHGITHYPLVGIPGAVFCAWQFRRYSNRVTDWMNARFPHHPGSL